MRLVHKTINFLRDKIFRQLHVRNLVYNTCWEDPRCDRAFLDIKKDSSILMITSAGCNALDYLLDKPEAIHCIDMNPMQNALLELKIALFKHGNYDILWNFFGKGYHQDADIIFNNHLQTHLSDFARGYWSKHISSFSKKTFYFHGTTGIFAKFFYHYIRSKSRLKFQISDLLEADSLETQAKIYHQIEPRVITHFIKWLLNRHFTLALLGVPRPQRNLIVNQYPGGLAGFITDSLRHVFTGLPVKDNYFWRLYLTGNYTPGCCPNYLKRENFHSIARQVSKIRIHTSTLSQFLSENPGAYSHYVLLDHQDWLAAHDPEALNQEWRLIVQNSRYQTKVLMRSASRQIDFFPDYVIKRVSFNSEKARELHALDRVGTYGSLYLGVL